ncbi:MAG: hypothetical protein N2442_02835 [Spirochaetes bacterium]|nr:hypothetical protein [Spirochaetota bacterium]
MQKSVQVRWGVFLLLSITFVFLGIRIDSLPSFSFLPFDLQETKARSVARSILSSMSLEEKCASLLLVAYGGSNRFTEEFASQYKKYPVGGVLFFAYNIPNTVENLMDLTSGIRKVGEERGLVPFVVIDHEGGTVLRLKGLTTDLPDAREIGKSKASEETIRRLFQLTARQLALLGFTMNLAPVVEPLTPETQSFLSRRSYSLDPARSAEIGAMFLQEMREAGVLGVAKHFPGTGDGDPHERLPKSSAKPTDPSDPYSLPFRILQKKGVLEALMVSHVRLPREGVQEPATLSSLILQKVLRNLWDFEGLIVTDDFRMKSLTQSQDAIEGVVRSIAAGADLVMYLGGEYPRVHEALVKAVREGRIPLQKLNESVERVLTLKAKYGIAKGTVDRKKERISNGGAEDPANRISEFYRLKKEGDALVQEILRLR